MCQFPTTTSIAMKRQKNLTQVSPTQTSSPEKESGEIDLTNLSEKEFKIKFITVIMELQRNMQELRHDVWKEITQMKQSLEGFISRMEEMQEAIDGIQTREQECIEADAERDKMISRNETILRELCNQSKRNNIRIIWIPEEERKMDRKCI